MAITNIANIMYLLINLDQNNLGFNELLHLR